MNYTQLVQAIKDYTESTETSFVSHIDEFIKQAEKKIYNEVQLPYLRKNVTGNASSGNKYVQTPSDFLAVYSMAIIDSSSDQHFLLNKDVNFLRDAYPVTTSAKQGRPKFYAYHKTTGSTVNLMLAPTPDQNYEIEHTYAKYPTSIVTAGGTYLGDNFDMALLNGALVEAIRFQKGEADVVAMYEKQYALSMGLLKNSVDGKLRQDMYRSGQFRQDAT